MTSELCIEKEVLLPFWCMLHEFFRSMAPQQNKYIDFLEVILHLRIPHKLTVQIAFQINVYIITFVNIT